jgi:hypothetical protein
MRIWLLAVLLLPSKSCSAKATLWASTNNDRGCWCGCVRVDDTAALACGLPRGFDVGHDHQTRKEAVSCDYSSSLHYLLACPSPPDFGFQIPQVESTGLPSKIPVVITAIEPRRLRWAWAEPHVIPHGTRQRCDQSALLRVKEAASAAYMYACTVLAGSTVHTADML